MKKVQKFRIIVSGHDIVAYDWNYYLDFADEKMR